MRAWQKGTYKTVQYHHVKGRYYADYHDSFQHIHYVLFHFQRLSVLYGGFLQIVTFAGIYFKLGDLMAMFSLQSSDTQQVGRRIMRRPYMFLGRSARRLERKIGRTVAAGAAGGVAGAVVASNSRKADTAKGNSHTRPNHDTASDTSTLENVLVRKSVRCLMVKTA